MSGCADSSQCSPGCQDKVKNLGTRDVQIFHPHSLKVLSLPTSLDALSAFPAAVLTLSGLCRVSTAGFSSCKAGALCQDMAHWGCRRARHPPALGTQKTLKASHIQDLAQAADPLSGPFPAPGLPHKQHTGSRKGCRMCKHKGSSWSRQEWLRAGAARPGENAAIHVSQGKITSPDPDG